MNRRIGEVVLIAIAIVLVLLGVLSSDWLAGHADDVSVRVGLREATACEDGRCQAVELRNVGLKPSVAMSGNAAYFSALLAVVLGALAGGFHLAGKTVVGPISPARLAAAFFGVTSIAGVVFLLSMDADMLGVGMSGPQAIAGGIFGLVGSVMIALRRDAGPSAPSPAAWSPASTTMSPACPQCGAPTQLNAQHQRWYCAACRAYV